MRRWARGPGWSGAIVGVVLLALVPGAALARPAPDSAAEASAERKKPKPVSCRPTQVRVTIKGHTRCAALPTKPASGDGRLAFARAFFGRDTGTLRTRGGRRVRSIWKARPQLSRVRAKLLRALPKALAFADRRARASARVPGDPPSCGSAQQPRGQTSSDGFSMSFGDNGDVTMTAAAGGLRIEAFLGGMIECADLDLPECPTPEGRLDGTDGRRTELGLRVTRNGELVQSLRTTVRSRQSLKGRVTEDAKLDRMDFQDTANETLSYQVPGQTVLVRVVLRATATLHLPGGAITDAQVVPGGDYSGTTQADAATVVNRTTNDYVQRFPDLVRKEGAHLTRRERLWQTPKHCAKLVFDPATSTRKVDRGVAGQATGRIEANAGGVAAKAKWTLSAPENGTISLAAPNAPSAAINYTPTGREGQQLKASFRVTSTAGVAEDPWAQEIVESTRHFKVTGLSYTDHMTANNILTYAGCSYSSSQNNTTTFEDSGAPTDGAVGPNLSGTVVGSLIGRGNLGKYAEFSGCQWNDDASARVSCTLTGTGTEPYLLFVDIELPAGNGPARVTWRPRAPNIGDVPPTISACEPFPITATPPDPVTTDVPRNRFTDAGAQSIALDAPGTVAGVGGVGTIVSTAHYELSFRRVNEDGSPYGS